MATTSKIYLRYKALGYVSNHIPVVTRYIDRRKENLCVTCVGKAFHTYNSTQFKLLSVSGLHPEDITCIAADKFQIYTAAGNVIYAWRRGSELKHVYKGHEQTVHLLLAFGPHLISIDEGSNLKIWDIKSEELVTELEFKNEIFEVSAVMHPVTYLNKILLGSQQGSLQLWNIHTMKLIYSFKGWGSSVSVIEQSPAVDVVGIGLQNGHIILHNLKYDETIMEFHQDWGIVTSLTFRTDNYPIMISGTMIGHIVLWNLDERKVFAQLLNAHEGSVAGLKCLPDEPLMVSSSPDNSLKLWIFDMPDGSARLLRLREGHSLPPSYIRFHGSNGHNLLSAGGDSCLRIFNTQTETFNKSLGVASHNRKKAKKVGKIASQAFKMPPIVQFTFETTREKEWDNIAAVHLGTTEVTTWSYGKLKMGDLRLIHDRFIKYKKPGLEMKYNGTPSSLCLTHCGNFVIIGYTSGHCDRYNIQSGIYRCSYGNDKAHEKSVRGVVSDMLSQIVITGGGDKLLKWWNFDAAKSKMEIHKLELEDAVAFFVHHLESSITAVALDNFVIVLIDDESRNIIRKFQGHYGRLTDATFSPDGRWLVTAGMDCKICTWDVPSGMLIDHFEVDAACTSLSFSPTGELLATTHVDYLGVFLWSNKTLYSHVTLKPITNTDDLPKMDLPSTTQQSTSHNQEETDKEENQYQSCKQIEDLITMSDLPSSRWQNLLNIDIIRKRNKPKNPPKTPKAAPFFLPTIPSLDIRFDFSNFDKDNEKDSSISKVELLSLTAFGKLLKETEKAKNFEQVFEKLKSMGPTAIDFEINSLSSDDRGSVGLIHQFMKMIKFVLDGKTDFELAEAYLGLLLKVHGQVIMENELLRDYLLSLQRSQENNWKRIQESFLYNLCVLQSLKI